MGDVEDTNKVSPRPSNCITKYDGKIDYVDWDIGETNERALASQEVAGLKLPLELIEAIIDEVDDKETLKAFSLTCLWFRLKCQSILFEEWSLNADTQSALFKQDGVLNGWIMNPQYAHILKFIKRLKFVNLFGGRIMFGSNRVVDGIMGFLLRKLNGLEKLEFYGPGFEWERRGITDGLMAVLRHTETLKEIRFNSVQEFPIQVLFWGKWLRLIEMNDSIIFPGTYEEFIYPEEGPSLEAFSYKARAEGLRRLYSIVLSNPLGKTMFSSLKRLCVEYHEGENDTIERMDDLLTPCQDTLEELDLQMPMEAYEKIPLYVNSIRLGRLNKLRVFFADLFLTTVGEFIQRANPFKYLIALLEDGPKSLQKIHLVFYHRGGHGHIDPEARPAVGFRDLDRLLTTALPGLTEVSVVVCCTMCTNETTDEHKETYDLPLVREKGIELDLSFTKSINSTVRTF